MTEDVKATRLSKAAREFNVGISTIVEFLHKKGFDLDPNPNTKLPNAAYTLLIKEYSTDINVKKESAKLVIKDLHKKKESLSIDDVLEEEDDDEYEQDIVVKDVTSSKQIIDLRQEIKKPDIKLVDKIDLDKFSKPKKDKPEIEPAQQPAPVVKSKVEKVEIKEKEPEPPLFDEVKANIDLRFVGKIDLETLPKESRTSRREDKKNKKHKKPAETPAPKTKHEIPKPPPKADPVVKEEKRGSLKKAQSLLFLKPILKNLQVRELLAKLNFRLKKRKNPLNINRLIPATQPISKRKGKEKEY